MMFRRKSVIIALLLSCSGCTKVRDLQPEDKEIVTTTVIQAIQRTYPGAKDFAFKTFKKGKIWIADFSLNDEQLRTQVNGSSIISPVCERLPEDFAKYKSFTNRLSIRGGEFSELLKFAGDTTTTRIMRYKWKGNTCLTRFQKNSILLNTDQISLTSSNALFPCYVTQEQLLKKINHFFEKVDTLRLSELKLCQLTLDELKIYDPNLKQVKVEEMNLCSNGLVQDGRFENRIGYESESYPGVIFQKYRSGDNKIAKIHLTKNFKGYLPDGIYMDLKALKAADILKRYNNLNSWTSRGCSEYWEINDNKQTQYYVKIDKDKKPRYPVDEKYYSEQLIEGIDIVADCYSYFQNK